MIDLSDSRFSRNWPFSSRMTCKIEAIFPVERASSHLLILRLGDDLEKCTHTYVLLTFASKISL